KGKGVGSMQSTKRQAYILCLQMMLVSTGWAQGNQLGASNEQRAVNRQQAMATFDAWAKRYATSASVRASSPFIAEGLALAKERRTALLELIKSEPRRALATAIPNRVRKGLPADIQNQLEAPVSAVGDLLVLCMMPPKGGNAPGSIHSHGRLSARPCIATVYSRLVPEPTKDGMRPLGVALDCLRAQVENVLAELFPTE